MTEQTQTLQPSISELEQAKRKSTQRDAMRIIKYMAVRLVVLFITVVIAIYLTILIANMGGKVDDIKRGEIREGIMLRALNDPVIKNLPPEERTARMEGLIQLEEKRLGLNQPFLMRSFSYLADGLSLNLGRAERMSSDSGSRQVSLIILERLPSTLVLFGTVSLILFFVEILIALRLSRNYGGFLDKVFVTLAPTSAAPAWFYGIFLILLFAALLKWLPFGGMVDAPPPSAPLDYFFSLLRHMILPAMALAVSGIFLATYTWRTFFLIYSSEDYVEMAKAKGLTSKDIERRYVLRPTLPTIITSFSLLLIGVWTGAPIFETVFNWPGLGKRFLEAVNQYDTPVIVASTVLFAYLLAITVFLLDFFYVLVDPRVKVGGGGQRS